MTCDDFQRRLVDGRSSREMTAHAAICPRCDRALRATEELERLLAVVVPAKTSAAFNDAVMRRLHDNAWAALLSVLAEPVVPLSIALSIAIAWLSPALTIHVAFAFAPLVFVLSWQLFRVYERMTTPEIASLRD